MKKLFAIIFLMSISLAMFAQSTSPRFGTLKNQDNTGRVLTYKAINIVSANLSGANKAYTMQPNAFLTIYRITLPADTTALTLTQPTVSNACLGDEIVIIASAASSTPLIKFQGSNWINAGTATLSTKLRAVIKMVFDGAKWVESYRLVQ
jgi:hypothetical protein